MRKLLFVLLCFPFLLYSKDRIYDKTMSLSQFVNELKEASENGKEYSLENCYIAYTNNDQQYLTKNNSTATIESLDFSPYSKVIIKNCKFGSQISKESINSRG